MVMLLAMAVMTAFGVWTAERWFSSRRWLAGLWLGLLAIVANTCSVMSVAEYDIALSLRDGPVVAAAIFFGPLAGILAGAMAALERALTPLWGVGSATWCPLSAFLVSLVAAAVQRWFLDRRRPALVPALALAFIFEGLHLIFDLLMGLDRLGRCCEIIFNAFWPEAAALMVALALSTVLVGSVGSLSRNLRSNASLILGAFVVFYIIIARVAFVQATTDTADRGENARRRLKFLFDAQIDFMMHHDALMIADVVGTLRDMSSDEVSSIIKGSRYDEMCVVNPQGRIVGANDPKLYAFDFSKHDKARRYLKLARGEETYIGEPFRASGLDGVCLKYGGVPLPDYSGFIQLGYSYERLESEFSRFFFPIFDMDIRIAEDDYYFVTSTNDERVIISSRYQGELEGRTIGDLGMTAGEDYARVLGVWCHVCPLTIGEWRVYCMLPISETFGPAAIQCGIVMLLIFSFMFFFRMVMQRFRKQREKIDQLRAESDERLHKDLLLAQKIQLSYLPEELPAASEFALTARMLPAREVGGDFYDAFHLSDGRLALVVADVSGKGVPAAMFMIKAKTCLQEELTTAPTLADAVARANDRLCVQNYVDMFVTAWVGVFDPANGLIDCVNAGHNPPLVRHRDGTVEWLRERGGPALAALPGITYRSRQLRLEPGEELLLYTDGITEAMNVADVLYGEERLAHFFTAAGPAVVEALFRDVACFASGAEQSDDITAMHFVRRAASGAN